MVEVVSPTQDTKIIMAKLLGIKAILKHLHLDISGVRSGIDIVKSERPGLQNNQG